MINYIVYVLNLKKVINHSTLQYIATFLWTFRTCAELKAKFLSENWNWDPVT